MCIENNFLEFKSFPEENDSRLEEIENFDDNYFSVGIKTRTLSKLQFENDLLFVCQCADMYYNHYLCEGKCNSCSCQELIWPEICVEIVYTLADLFEVENSNHADRDSPQWWMYFKVWYENLCNYED